MKIDPKNFPLPYFMGGVIKTMNEKPNSPTRSKSEFSGENFDDDFSQVVVLPRWLFWTLVTTMMISMSFAVWLHRQYASIENPNLPRIINVDGGCTIEARAVTLKGTTTAYRLLPVDAPTPAR